MDLGLTKWARLTSTKFCFCLLSSQITSLHLAFLSFVFDVCSIGQTQILILAR